VPYYSDDENHDYGQSDHSEEEDDGPQMTIRSNQNLMTVQSQPVPSLALPKRAPSPINQANTS
jgi:hypothetical protein